MLDLVYKFIQPHFDPRTHCFLTTQTDSLSLSLSEDSLDLWLERCVLPEKRESMLAIRDQYLVLPGKSEAARRSGFEKGLFKTEWQGHIFIVRDYSKYNPLKYKPHSLFGQQNITPSNISLSPTFLCPAKYNPLKYKPHSRFGQQKYNPLKYKPHSHFAQQNITPSSISPIVALASKNITPSSISPIATLPSKI